MAGAGTLVGLAVGIISVLPIIFDNSSSLDTLSLSASPYRTDEVKHYLLPLDAPIEQLPSSDAGCSKEQSAWLDEHGRAFQRDYLVEVRNTADSGPFIALQNFHGSGELRSSSEGLVIECDMSSSTAVAEPAHLQLDTTVGAYFDKSRFGNAGQGAPNTPLAYNLEPGETGQIVLSLSSLQDFEGTLQVTAAVGDDIQNLPIALPAADSTISFFGSSLGRAVLLRINGNELLCESLSASVDEECDARSFFAK